MIESGVVHLLTFAQSRLQEAVSLSSSVSSQRMRLFCTLLESRKSRRHVLLPFALSESMHSGQRGGVKS